MILVKSGSPLDMKNKNGQTPLHIAVERNSWFCVRFLVESGCNVNLPNRENLKPIQIAIANQNEDIIRTLAENGAEIPEGRYKKAFGESRSFLPSFFLSLLQGLPLLMVAIETHKGQLKSERRVASFLSRGTSYFIKVICVV